MTGSLRVRLQPTPAPTPTLGERSQVTGLTVSLERLGPDLTKAKVDSPQPAELTLVGFFYERARAGSTPTEQSLVTIRGMLELRGPSRRPVFLADETPVRLTQAPDDAAEPAGGVTDEGRRPRPRCLELALAPESFAGFDLNPAERRIALPHSSDPIYYYVEVGATLQVGGATECHAGQGDLLDVLLSRESPPFAPALEVCYVDEIGRPLDGLAVEITHRGTPQQLTTDGRGVAWVEAEPGDTGSVRVADVAGLRARMKPRWDQVDRVSSNGPLRETNRRTVQFLRGDALEAVALTTERSHTVSIQPYVLQARLFGLYFDTNKCFLLPTAIPGIRLMKGIYDENTNTELLIVGHTDTSSEDSYNETLSLERAQAMAAYLKDDVDAWLEWYGWGKSDSKRWAEYEDDQMMQSLASTHGFSLEPESVLGYQRWHNGLEGSQQAPNWEQLDEDGKIGPKTRAQLVGDYMHHDQTSLPADAVTVKVHGCGEYYPLDETGTQLDAAPVDGAHERPDRRVELFFFDRELGVQPPVGNATTSKRGSREYPEWRNRAARRFDFDGGAADGAGLRIRLHDAECKPVEPTGGGVPYQLTYGGETQPPELSYDGWVRLDLPPTACFEQISIEWGTPDESGEYPFQRTLMLVCGQGTERQMAHARLYNLGYRFDIGSDEEYDEAVRAFQCNYGVVDEVGLDEGALPSRTKQRLWAIYASECDATPTPIAQEDEPESHEPDDNGAATTTST